MTVKEAVAVFWKAYKSLPKNQRGKLVERIVSSRTLSEDQIDHILIERSRREKGHNITLNAYIKEHLGKR